MERENRDASVSHANFRRSIRGQQATLPNLYSLFPEWKPALHPEYERAWDEVLNPWLQRWVPDAVLARKFQRADFGAFAAVMCARTSFEKLCTVSKAFAWYFIWDDLFDCGSLTHQKELMTEYKHKSMQYFSATLCGKEEFPDLSSYSRELQNALHCWDEVAAHLRLVCSRETLELLLSKKLLYMASIDTVDKAFAGDEVPSLKQYWRHRERSAGVYPVIATIPFIYEIEISGHDIDSNLMRLLWRHTSYLVHVANDMFSLRKEIGDNQIENIIPVLMLNHGIDCNQAMRLSHGFLQETARGFHEVEQSLRRIGTHTTNTSSEVFIEGCKNIAMGLTYWSYSGERYFKQAEFKANHEVDFHL